LSNLISKEYREMQAKLHEDINYGVASVAYAPIVDEIIKNHNITNLLDYGAGKCRLKDAIKSTVNYTPYEPSNELWSQTPEPNEFVTCIDVLEHIEPELLDNVLDDLQRVVDKYGLFTIHTGPAQKTLPDGRNAHLIQQPLAWWSEKLIKRFTILKQVSMGNGCIVFLKKL
jgi:hypothetical protein